MAPPLAVSVALYAVPMVALGREVEVTVNGIEMVMVSVCVALVGELAESVTVTEKELVTAALDGVPEMTPDDAIVSPAGRVAPAVSDQV